ncbi:hypothetical protein M514_19137 [Trichuris suis]|uniref:Uncharacterized protein n=1 Tax=Trichuris suis TaxID=68888 RepID=A0A085NGU8_9BILA|nr:hypothetical protein M514_19137 [Trichuris suis]
MVDVIVSMISVIRICPSSCSPYSKHSMIDDPPSLDISRSLAMIHTPDSEMARYRGMLDSAFL